MQGAVYSIEVNLQTVEQLFNSLDPSPFHERDLDEKAEHFILGWAREAKGSEQLQLTVTLPEDIHNSEVARRIPEAIHNHFGYRAMQAKQDLHELLRIGRQSLAIGMLVLLVCFGAIRYVSLMAGSSAASWLLVESLLILGWVANWRPMEIFLYEWWPIRRKIILYRRLAEMTVVVRPSVVTTSP